MVDALLDDPPLTALLAALLDAHAPMRPCALVPTLSAWHAEDELPLWQALESALHEKIGAPFFCVAWPGAQALARALLERVVEARGLTVADLGCGSGVASVAALRAGAAHVLAVDVDALAVRAARILAERHGVRVEGRVADALAHPEIVDEADVVLAGDLVYSESQRAPFQAAVARWRAAGKVVLLADSGRPFFDACGLRCVAEAGVPVPHGVEGTSTRTVRLYATGASGGSTAKVDAS